MMLSVSPWNLNTSQTSKNTIQWRNRRKINGCKGMHCKDGLREMDLSTLYRERYGMLAGNKRLHKTQKATRREGNKKKINRCTITWQKMDYCLFKTTRKNDSKTGIEIAPQKHRGENSIEWSDKMHSGNRNKMDAKAHILKMDYSGDGSVNTLLMVDAGIQKLETESEAAESMNDKDWWCYGWKCQLCTHNSCITESQSWEECSSVQ